MISSLLRTMKPLFDQTLERAVQRVIDLDPDTQRRLRDLEGRSVVFCLEKPPICLHLSVDGGQLRLHTAEVVPVADLSVRTSLRAVISRWRAHRAVPQPPQAQQFRVKNNGWYVAGDADLAQHLQHILTGFDPDWSLPLVRVLGPDVGEQVAKIGVQVVRSVNASTRLLAKNTRDFIVEEVDAIVTTPQWDAFQEDVAQLDADVKRLAQQINKLQDAKARQ